MRGMFACTLKSVACLPQMDENESFVGLKLGFLSKLGFGFSVS